MNRLQKALKNNPGAPLLGAAAYSYNPTFLEIAALLGYKAAWIEMEHTFLSHEQAADLCRIASGMGMLTMIRIPDTRREIVLKAAECGPDILDLPMVNSAEMLSEFVRHARFPPKGVRGFFSTSRAVKYGLDGPVSDKQQMLNQELCLMAQIETKEAVDKIEELLAVPGIDSIFIGPAVLVSQPWRTWTNRSPAGERGCLESHSSGKNTWYDRSSRRQSTRSTILDRAADRSGLLHERHRSYESGGAGHDI